MIDSTFEQSRTSPLIHGEFEQLLLACSEGCGLHHNSQSSVLLSSAHQSVLSMLLVAHAY